MNLNGLGNDILGIVLNFLEPIDWCRVQSVCKTWRWISLKKKFEHSYKFNGKEDSDWNHFLKEISNKFILTLDLSRSNCLGPHRKYFRQSLVVKELILNEIVSSDRLYRFLCNEFKSNFLKNILSDCKTLKTLEWCDYAIDDSWLEKSYQYPFNSKQAFKSVERLKIGYYGTSPIDVIAGNFPSLKMLHLNFLALVIQNDHNLGSKRFQKKMKFPELLKKLPGLQITYNQQNNKGKIQ